MSSIQISYLWHHKQLIVCIVLMVRLLYDVLELKKVLPFMQNFLFFWEFLYLCSCATPLGSGGGGACCPQVPVGHPRLSIVCPLRGRWEGEVGMLLSAGGSPMGSITLRLLLTCEPDGVIGHSSRVSLHLTRFVCSDTACRVTIWPISPILLHIVFGL